MTVALFVLVAGAVAFRGLRPDLLERRGPALWIYVGLVTATLPLVVFLGHDGGKLLFGWRKPPHAISGGDE